MGMYCKYTISIFSVLAKNHSLCAIFMDYEPQKGQKQGSQHERAFQSAMLFVENDEGVRTHYKSRFLLPLCMP